MNRGFFILFLSFLSASALASETGGNDVGKGGDALRVNGKLYSLDLVDAGVQKNPYFNPHVPVIAKIREIVSDSLMSLGNAMTQPVVEKIAQKLSEIALYDRIMAYSLATAMQKFDWSLVETSLIDVQDEDMSLQYDRKDLEQVAVRREHRIQIYEKFFTELDESNRAALILHEAIYAMILPVQVGVKKLNEREIIRIYAQKSPVVRSMVGGIFTPKFGSATALDYYKQLFGSRIFASKCSGANTRVRIIELGESVRIDCKPSVMFDAQVESARVGERFSFDPPIQDSDFNPMSASTLLMGPELNETKIDADLTSLLDSSLVSMREGQIKYPFRNLWRIRGKYKNVSESVELKFGFIDKNNEDQMLRTIEFYLSNLSYKTIGTGESKKVGFDSDQTASSVKNEVYEYAKAYLNSQQNWQGY